MRVLSYPYICICVEIERHCGVNSLVLGNNMALHLDQPQLKCDFAAK